MPLFPLVPIIVLGGAGAAGLAYEYNKKKRRKARRKLRKMQHEKQQAIQREQRAAQRGAEVRARQAAARVRAGVEDQFQRRMSFNEAQRQCIKEELRELRARRDLLKGERPAREAELDAVFEAIHSAENQARRLRRQRDRMLRTVGQV